MYLPQQQQQQQQQQEASPSPVLIPLHNDFSASQGPPEWAMIELNAELIAPQREKENPDDNESLVPVDQVELGLVRFVDNKPVMIVGSHELQGKIETLKQPFCVLEKESSTESGTSYRIGGIVTRKLLFDKYPKVILR